MTRRLIGLETEYAIRYTPVDPADPSPGNRAIFEALAQGIQELVQTLPARTQFERHKFFLINGGAFCYEALPTSPDGGLIEGATPECRGARQLFLYQRAQDDLLRRAIALAQEALREQGWRGQIGVLKNCRDALGNIYGAQENYEATVATGGRLWLYRASLALTAALLIIPTLLTWLLLVLMVLGMISFLLGLMMLAVLAPGFVKRKKLGRLLTEEGYAQILEPRLGRVTIWMHYGLWWPALWPFLQALRATAFVPQRRAITGFLVSRAILSGCGFVDEEGHFFLSEKGSALREAMRRNGNPSSRSIFDTGNLMKPATDLALLQLGRYKALFAPRQRMQLGLADSNVAQVAELLKIGSTLLVLEMAEAGELEDAPQLRDPVAAMHAISADPTLRAQVALKGGGVISALELQRFYQGRAQRFLDDHPAPALEDLEAVKQWGEALDALEEDPGLLIGRLDWVTKRFLLESCAQDAPYEVRKKIDLRYHELGEGYLAQLEEEGVAPRLLEASQLEEAALEAPSDTPAALRSRVMRSLSQVPQEVYIGWNSVRIGSRLKGRVIQLSDYRKQTKPEREP